MSPLSEDPDQEPSAPLWRHLLAMVYDSLLIVPLFMAATALWVSMWGPTENALVQTVPPVVQWLSWTIILLLFFGLFWRKNGQTLGMQAWRIKLISEVGEQPTWPQVAARLLGATISVTACGIGYIWKWMPPRYRYWHDTLSRTRLILLPKRD